MSLELIPITLAEAKAFIGKEHRHHAPPVGHKWSIGVAVHDEFGPDDLSDSRPPLRGVVVVGRPVSREIDKRKVVAEVTRLATDGTKNACSILYAAAARAAQAMGYKKIQTYILEDEPGTSLKAAGWHFESWTSGGNWNHGQRKGRREDQPMCKKQRWAKNL